MRLDMIFALILFTTANANADGCGTNERVFVYESDHDKTFFCCTTKSCRPYRGETPQSNNVLDITKCSSEPTFCTTGPRCLDNSNTCFENKLYFVCGGKSDCSALASTGEYCCRSQFCAFGKDCALEPLAVKLSKSLFIALLCVAIALFVINLTVNAILLCKLCGSRYSKESNYVVRDNGPGLNIFLPSQYEGGQGMTPGGEIIVAEKKKTMRSKKTRRKKRHAGTPEIVDDPTVPYPMPDPVGNSYLENQQTQDYAVPPLPEDLGADFGEAQFQQREDMIGVSLGNMSLNGPPGMEIDEYLPQNYAENPNAGLHDEDVNY